MEGTATVSAERQLRHEAVAAHERSIRSLENEHEIQSRALAQESLALAGQVSSVQASMEELMAAVKAEGTENAAGAQRAIAAESEIQSLRAEIESLRAENSEITEAAVLDARHAALLQAQVA